MENPGGKHTYWSRLVGVSCPETRERCDDSVKTMWSFETFRDEVSSLPQLEPPVLLSVTRATGPSS